MNVRVIDELKHSVFSVIRARDPVISTNDVSCTKSILNSIVYKILFCFSVSQFVYF